MPEWLLIVISVAVPATVFALVAVVQIISRRQNSAAREDDPQLTKGA